MNEIISSILLLAIMAGIGYIAEKTGYVKGIKEGVGKIITRITLPLLVIININKQTMNMETLKQIGIVAGVALLVLTVLMLVGMLTAKIFKLEGGTKSIHICLSTFGNVVFMAYPLITAIYGQTGLMHAVIFAAINDIFLYTVGIFILSGGGKGGSSIKKLLNPNTISLVLAMIILCLGIPLKGLFFDALETVGNATLPLSMLFIGATLTCFKISMLKRIVPILPIIFIKMIAIPLLLFLILQHVLPDKIMLGVIVLLAAMPSQSVIALIAPQYGGDENYGALAIFITTIASAVTLPFIYSFLI